MKIRQWLAGFLACFPLFYLALDSSELIRTRSDSVHLYPFGSEHVAHNYFYQSLFHYRVMLGIGICLSLVALVSVVKMWRERNYAWVWYIPFVAWTLTLITITHSGE